MSKVCHACSGSRKMRDTDGSIIPCVVCKGTGVYDKELAMVELAQVLGASVQDCPNCGKRQFIREDKQECFNCKVIIEKVEGQFINLVHPDKEIKNNE